MKERLVAAVVLGLAASCAGRSMSEVSDDVPGDGSSPRRSSTGGTAATAAAGGSSGTEPRAPALGKARLDDVTLTSTGRASASGGTASDTPPSNRDDASAHDNPSADGGRPGTQHPSDPNLGEGGHGGADDSPDPDLGDGGYAGEPTAIDCNSRSYETGVYGERCSDGDAYAQGPTYVLVPGALDIDACKAACTERADCKGVSDYFELHAVDACYLLHDSCESPAKPVWAEEDGGRTFRKSCDGAMCTYESIGFERCDPNGTSDAVTGATSVADCITACDADEMCTGVVDYFYQKDVRGHCFLNVGTCAGVVDTFEEGYLHRRTCP